MRKLKLQVQITIDGFIGGMKGELDFMEFEWDDQLKQYIQELTESVDCIILGRKLAEGFIPYWASHPQEEGADRINKMKKIVFTKTLEVSPWENTVLAKGDLIEEVAKLKNQDGKDIIVYGGAGFVSALLQHRLIDELHLLVNPTAIGKGLPIFANVGEKLSLQLVQSTSYACGIAVLHYDLK